MSDGYFAQLETSFILNDPRLDEMTNSQRFCYIVLWCYAVDQHKETLNFPNLPRTLSRVCRNDTRTVRLALTKLRELCLIEMPDENTVTVCGVKKKHPKLKWRDSRVEPPVKTLQGNRVDKSRVDKIRVEKSSGSSSDHSLFVKYYCEEYEKKFGIKYAFDGGKDANTIKTLLTQFDYKKLCDMALLFFKDGSDFVAGHTVGKFKFQAQALAEQLKNPKKNLDYYLDKVGEEYKNE